MPKPARHKPITHSVGHKQPPRQPRGPKGDAPTSNTLKPSRKIGKQQQQQQRKPRSSGDGPRPGSSSGLQCMNPIHRQAAFAVQRLVTADATKSKGASLKSLTLAPHIENKRATYAVTCQVLKCEGACHGAGGMRPGTRMDLTACHANCHAVCTCNAHCHANCHTSAHGRHTSHV